MQRLNNESSTSTTIQELCEEYRAHNMITKEEYEQNRVKRGLRNADGTGVMAGLTHVCNVHGYLIADGDKIPDEGKLTYRGISVSDIVAGCEKEDRFGFEEVVWLLIFGKLPNRRQFDRICGLLYDNRELPEYFPEDLIIKTPSKDVMNKLARSVLGLYSYDDDPDDLSLENNMRQSISLIARLPAIMSYAYQVKRRHFDKESMFFHPFEQGHCTAEAILNALRPDRKFTKEEARLLDLCMVLHAEHGGGNNSTFVCRALSSSGTDTYSAIAGAVGSLKGPLHGGANAKVMEMFRYVKENVNPKDDGSIRDYLAKLLNKEAGDHSGKIYGLGHAVYTISDPRAVLLKKYAKHMAEIKGYAEDFQLLEKIEEMGIPMIQAKTGSEIPMCANVDMYSGLVYTMLGIPEDVFTPLFASARIAGWCANRIEEVVTCHRIMRPAYRAVIKRAHYDPIEARPSHYNFQL